MSTLPFTLIEGSMALPRVRPFGHLPAPFGRDWAMLPPGYSLRAELKALYAAMLRTFCMSDQAIRSICRWVPLDANQQPVLEGSGADGTQATIFDPPLERVAPLSAPTHRAASLDERVFAPVPRKASVHWGAVAGGACALGGVAILGWIALGHLSQRPTTINPKLAGTVSAVGESRLTRAGLPDAVARREAGHDSAEATLPFVPSPRAVAAPVLVRDVADKPGPALRSRPQEKAGRPHEVSRRREAQAASANRASRPTFSPRHLSRSMVPANASMSSPKPSSAGPYSPLTPSRLGVDEYASVTLSAATPVRDIATLRPASSRATSATAGTEWMNHLSQRRITEVPDQFAR